MLVGVVLLVFGGLSVWRVARADGPYRGGPWPGLTPAGAAVLLGCALLLAGDELLLGDPHRPLPDLPLLSILAVWPMALATRLVGAPGAASAVSGAYLLPRTLLSLLDSTIQPAPLLLVPALAFDLSAWLRPNDLARLRHVWPGRHSQWRRDLANPRHVGRLRAAVAGAVFGGVLTAVEAPFAVLLGADPAAWSAPGLWLPGALSTCGCAIAALAVSGRGTTA